MSIAEILKQLQEGKVTASEAAYRIEELQAPKTTSKRTLRQYTKDRTENASFAEQMGFLASLIRLMPLVIPNLDAELDNYKDVNPVDIIGAIGTVPTPKSRNHQGAWDSILEEIALQNEDGSTILDAVIALDEEEHDPFEEAASEEQAFLSKVNGSKTESSVKEVEAETALSLEEEEEKEMDLYLDEDEDEEEEIDNTDF